MADAAPQEDGWEGLVGRLAPHFSPEWVRQAQEHGSQPWVRLIALVDAHYVLQLPWLPEKIAQTMSDLAEGREAEQAGWDAIGERTRDQRLALQRWVEESAPGVLPGELVQYFTRSLLPTAAG